MRAGTMGKLRRKELEIQLTISDESHDITIQVLRRRMGDSYLRR
jgi:hypothetical protein